jgi:hypothetical protein
VHNLHGEAVQNLHGAAALLFFENFLIRDWTRRRIIVSVSRIINCIQPTSRVPMLRMEGILMSLNWYPVMNVYVGNRINHKTLEVLK